MDCVAQRWAGVGLFVFSMTSSVSADGLFYSGWTPEQHTSIQHRDLVSNAHRTLISGSAGNTGPMPHHFGTLGMAADDVNGWIYYAGSNGTVSRINFDGTGRVPLVASAGEVEDVALDLAGGKMYWCESNGDTIRRADLNGQNVETIVSTGLLLPTGIALDLERGRVYWSDYHADVIGSVKLDGSDRREFETDGAAPIDLVIDPINDKVVWADFDSYKIHRAGLDGSGQSAIVNGAHNVNLPGSITIDPEGQFLYWNDWEMGAIRRSNLDGSNVITVLNDPTIGPSSGLVWVPEPSTFGCLIVAAAATLPRRRRLRG